MADCLHVSVNAVFKDYACLLQALKVLWKDKSIGPTETKIFMTEDG